MKLPRLTIRPKEGGAQGILSGLDVWLDDFRLPGLVSLAVETGLDQVNVLRVEFRVGEMEIDVEALLELKARLDRAKT